MNYDYEISKYLPEDILKSLPIVSLKAGIIFVPIERQEKVRIYYILDGKVDVFCISYDGREYLIDELKRDDFIGKFSQYREVNLQCGARAATDIMLLDITDYFYGLNEENKILEQFFLEKTSSRLYRMYKLQMVRMQFKYDEIFAYSLIDSMDENHVIADVDEILYRMNISDRNIYYLIKRFKEKNLIKKTRNKIEILDLDELYAMAENVIVFMEN